MHVFGKKKRALIFTGCGTLSLVSSVCEEHVAQQRQVCMRRHDSDATIDHKLLVVQNTDLHAKRAKVKS